MSGVFRNIGPPPPPGVREEDTLARGRGGEESIGRKMPDTALYSIYVSTLYSKLMPLKLTMATIS
jgi:hypothetical protein